MVMKLEQVAQQLREKNKKVQLIYAFNGTGKTRLSKEFKNLIAPKNCDDEPLELGRTKILYYNAFTEDLFYWDNDLETDAEPILKIQPNTFTDWILKDQGQDQNIISSFQQYTTNKIMPHFSLNFSEVTFSIERGNDKDSGVIKISKGEESLFIWSIFYCLIEQVIEVLNVAEPMERETEQFNELEYIFIDDPVSSLDENHIIESAVNLATLIKSSDYTNGHGVRFIITTHNPLFYNVLHNELELKKKGKKEGCYLLERLEEDAFNLNVKYGDSNRSFSYHLYIKQLLKSAKANRDVKRYHFSLLRNLYEKTASFLGYKEWSDLLPDDKKVYLNRIIQFTNHSSLSSEEVSEPTEQERQMVIFLLEHLETTYNFYKHDEPNN